MESVIGQGYVRWIPAVYENLWMARRRALKVLLDNTIFEIHQGGGVARYFDEIIPVVAKGNLDIQFLLEGDKSMVAKSANIRRLKLLNPIQHRPWRLFWKHIHACRVRRFEAEADLFVSTYYVPKPRAQMKSVVVVYDFIDADLSCMNPNGYEFVRKQRKVIEDADAVIAISEETKHKVIRYTHIDASRVEVIYPIAGSGLLIVAPSEAIKNFRKKYNVVKPYWLYVGARAYYKNFDCVLRAFAMIAQESEDELLVVGGEKELTPHLLDFLFRKRLEHRVHLVGRLTDEDLSAAYAGTIGFVYPSFAEGFGIPLLEAMQSGVPVVASDIPVFREVAGDAAEYFDPHSAAGLARTMRTIKKQEARAHLIRLGYERIQHFSGKRAAEQMADLLRRVGEGGV